MPQTKMKRLPDYTNDELRAAGGTESEIQALRVQEKAHQIYGESLSESNNWGNLTDEVMNAVEDLSSKVEAATKTNNITKNGMNVSCYGIWEEGSNCVMIGDWSDGTELDEIWSGDDTETKTWTSAVNKITTWAKKNGHTIFELTVC